ncbi:MAG: PLP-dependent aminotransferase family protein [Gammaproteobacteria bacterium]|nr:PLP-dependent aminotransferase family protein [Gammaproteobacteria bacterium]
MTGKLARRMQRVKPSAIRELLRLGADPQIISFGGGYPDPDSFPRAELASAYQQALLEVGSSSLQYATSQGLERLRSQVAARMQREGVACSADEVLIVQGAQQGLDLIAKLLINRGDGIVTENPTFLGALIAFNPCQPRYAAVPMDEEGMRVDRLEAVLAHTPDAKLIYVIPDFQNPTGTSMSLARRRALIEFANRHDLMILEDSPYRDIRFAGQSLPPIKRFDTEDRVFYVGSFSKIIAPGLRLGWVVASRALIERLGLLKLAADTQCSTINMTATSLLLERFDLDAHIARVSEGYRRKKAVMLEAIRRTFPPEVRCTDPEGGLFTWLTFPDGFDSGRFLYEEAIPKAKVAYVPGATFFPLRQRPNHARLSYATQREEDIVRGITALGAVLDEEQARGWPHCGAGTAATGSD